VVHFSQEQNSAKTTLILNKNKDLEYSYCSLLDVPVLPASHVIDEMKYDYTQISGCSLCLGDLKEETEHGFPAGEQKLSHLLSHSHKQSLRLMHQSTASEFMAAQNNRF